MWNLGLGMMLGSQLPGSLLLYFAGISQGLAPSDHAGIFLKVSNQHSALRQGHCVYRQ